MKTKKTVSFTRLTLKVLDDDFEIVLRINEGSSTIRSKNKATPEARVRVNQVANKLWNRFTFLTKTDMTNGKIMELLEKEVVSY